MNTKKQFITYLIVTFGLAWILQFVACYFASIGYLNYFDLILAVSMFMPLIGGIVAKGKVKEIGWKPKFKGNGKYYWFSWLAPCILVIIGATLFFLIFPSCFGTLEEGLEYAGGPGFVEVLASQGISLELFFVIEIISAVIYAPLVNAFFAVGEEAGWRGVMYPYLKEKFGKVKGRILGGIIWGVWHYPVIILAGYEYGKDYFGAPFAGPIAFLIVTITLGIICDWVYEKSESIWTASILHGSVNGCAGLPLLLMSGEFTKWSILGPSFIGVISIIPTLLVAILILLKDKKKISLEKN